ncbi:hypothetical protein C8A00DRAFT_14341 [Chaetomidium leptoderma]|uniref:Uncharacterized protein n=1 Tax=Chaetomidium leptoderma TaxID=669021 RepID=A0AAN6ZZE5_9PEZI|nr:hypothetical protein C8A00DRAFT_14341 [Chaetomidium leptoderma]
MGWVKADYAAWARDASSAAAPPGPSTSPPFSPPRSPWAARSPLLSRKGNTVRPEESVSASPTPEHEPSFTKGGFTFSWDEIRDEDEEEDKAKFTFSLDEIRDHDDEEDESDSGTATPKGPAGARSPEYDAAATEVSYYSMTNLPKDHPERHIAATEVRAQTIAIPVTIVPRRKGFPHTYNNYEKLDLDNPPPLIEHPLTPDGSYVAGSPPGSSRIVTNESDHTTPEAMYHDPTKPIPEHSRYHPFSKAAFRGKDRSLSTGLEDTLKKMGI